MKINENSFPGCPRPPMAMSSGQLAMRGIVFVTHRVPKADLDEIPQPYCMVFRCASFWWPQNITDTLNRYQNTILTNPKTIDKISQTLKSQNQEKCLLRYAIRSQIVPRIQCRIPNQPNTHIRYKRLSKKRSRRQRRSL